MVVGVVVGHWPDVGTGGDLATVTWPRGYLVLELRVGLVAVALGRWPDVGTGMAWPSCRAGHRIARISQVVKMPQEAQQKRFGGVRRI